MCQQTTLDFSIQCPNYILLTNINVLKIFQIYIKIFYTEVKNTECCVLYKRDYK